ncbi:deoxyribonuclease IV [Chloroflexus sp.]|uniref:deoxyribonuclease IV n=1 Tax=Chloroflexus sp. TaxID=1904827 RepID=UPI002ADDEFD3|nr:deoxyribonuclease IV [Chloroflexus sp.]
MPRFGAHMSISGGVSKSFARGESVGLDSMQIFAKNERQWTAKPISPEEATAFRVEQQRTGIHPVVVHDSYLINLAAPADELREKSIAAFADELERCAQLDIPYLVTHPGAHTGIGEEAGLARVADAICRLLAEGVGGDTMILLETTAGQGTALGYRFEHLARLFELIPYHERLGICVDTCHIFAAGYDIRDPEGYQATFAELDRLVGLTRVKCFHLNDSQKDLGSRVDRHAHIGQGCIGVEAFRMLVNDPRFADLPMIIETPKGEDMAEDRMNLALLRSLVQGAE